MDLEAKKLADDIEEHLKKEAVFKIGVVNSVLGRKIKVEVFKNKNHPYLIYNGKITKNVSTGSYIKIKKGLTTIIGKIEGEEVTEEINLNNRYLRPEDRIKRFLNVSLLGHYERGRFLQGVKELPLIDNECYALEESDFVRLHNFFEPDDLTITLGELGDDSAHDVRACVNKLFASHIGIFGNTGSGKSNTLTRLYSELFDIMPDLSSFKENSRFIFIDFNGEYTREHVLCDNKKIYNLSTHKRLEDIEDENKYVISPKILKDGEIIAVLLNATEKTQKPFLMGVLESEYLSIPANYDRAFQRTLKDIVDRAQPGGLEKLLGFLEDLKSFCEVPNRQIIENLIQAIRTHLTQNVGGSYLWDARYNHDVWNEFQTILAGFSGFKTDLDAIDDLQLRIYLHYYFKVSISNINAEYVGPMVHRMPSKFEILKKVITVKEEAPEHNIAVVSLRNVRRQEIKKILPLLICKNLYELQKEINDGDGNIKTSLNIVIDEAHNILSEDSQRENEHWRDYRLETFEEIIKEGRKFGTFLTIASQRPYDISPTIISQLHNYFIHRLINHNDLAAVRKAVAYLDDLSFDTIPILSVGSCFFAGVATDIPVKVNVKLMEESERRPKSETVRLTEIWDTKETGETEL